MFKSSALKLLQFSGLFLLATACSFVLLSLKNTPKASATTCNNPGNWVSVDLHVLVQRTDGSTFYSNNFNFNVQSTDPSGYFHRPPGSNYWGGTIIDPGGGFHNNVDVAANGSNMHYCGVGPSYDFTDGSNGNYYLNCLEGVDHQHSVGFQFTGQSVNDAGGSGHWTNNPATINPTVNGDGTTSDLNKHFFELTLVYQLDNQPPPPPPPPPPGQKQFEGYKIVIPGQNASLNPPDDATVQFMDPQNYGSSANPFFFTVADPSEDRFGLPNPPSGFTFLGVACLNAGCEGGISSDPNNPTPCTPGGSCNSNIGNSIVINTTYTGNSTIDVRWVFQANNPPPPPPPPPTCNDPNASNYGGPLPCQYPPPPPPDSPPSVNIRPYCSPDGFYVDSSDPDGNGYSVQIYVDGSYMTGMWVGPNTQFFSMSGYDEYNDHTIYAYTNGRQPSSYSGSIQSAQDAKVWGRGGNMPGCKDRHFNAFPWVGTTTLNPDEEAPTSANFSGGGQASFDPGQPGPYYVNHVQVTKRYFIKHQDGSETNILGTPTTTDETIFSNHNDSNSQIPATVPGDQVCAQFWVYPTGSTIDVNGNIYSNNGVTSPPTNPSCARVYAKPYFRTYGADTITGSAVTCSGWGNSPSAGNIYGLNAGLGIGRGAGAQLAAMAVNRIEGFATAVGYNGAASPKPQSNSNGLSFANDGTGGPWGGNFGNNVPCPADYFTTLPSGPNVDTTTNVLGRLNINTNTSPNVYYFNGDIRITKDITFVGGGSWRVGNLPTLTVIAKGNIYIDPSVQHLDGLYIAKNTIYTCDNPAVGGFAKPTNAQLADSSDSNTCRNQLTVIGSFVASSVKLLRTANSLKDDNASFRYDSSKAGEIFMFSPESWLINLPFSPSSGSGDYDSSSNLPPVL